MNNKRNILLAITVLLWASLACQSLSPSGSDPASVPPESAATEEENSPLLPADSSTTEEAPAQTGGAYDGSWVGTNTVDDKEILFTVEDNQITSVALNYTGEAAGCTYSGAISKGVDTGGIDPVEINGDGFSMVNKNVNDELTFAGTFTSDSEANGTLLIKSSADGLCGEYEKEISWTASKGSRADAEATEDTSGLASGGDAVAVVTEFFDAVNTGDVDAAVEMVDDNVMFSFGAANTQFGRDNLSAFLSSSGVTYEISQPESLGGAMVQFTATASDGTTYSFCNVVLQDGMIVSLTLQP
jgi:hypothetical protein